MPTQTTKTVSFGDITITEYPIVLGDHPSCTGCPITIGWEPMRRYTWSLDEYEQNDHRLVDHHRILRGGGGGGGLGNNHLVIPVRERSRILLEAGYTPRQIVERTLEVFEIRDRREESLRSSLSCDEKPGKLSKTVKATLIRLSHITRGQPRQPPGLPQKRSVTASTA